MSDRELAEHFEGMSTIVPVRDVVASAAFYRDMLDFELRTIDGDNQYALLAIGHASVMLLGTDDATALAATATNVSAYFWIDDVDALWERYASRLSELPEGRVRVPFNQPYGAREFHVKDPDGFLMFFGHIIRDEG